jgi:hypothetical protein
MQAMKTDLASQLGEALRTTDDQHVYALIDGALKPDAWAFLSRRFEVASLLPDATDGGQSAAAALPFLLLIEGDRASDAIRLTVDLAFENHAATWLRSPLKLPELANHLAQRLQGEVPDMAVVLRFADARVLPALRTVLEPEQVRQFFAGITGWWYLERNFELAELARLDANSTLCASDTFVPPMVLTDQQETWLMEAAEPDAVIALMAQHDAQALEKLPKDQQHSFVKENMLAARDWDITSPADQALFCMIALEHSPEALASDAWQQALQQVKSKRIRLMQALEQMTS